MPARHPTFNHATKHLKLEHSNFHYCEDAGGVVRCPFRDSNWQSLRCRLKRWDFAGRKHWKTMEGLKVPLFCKPLI